MLKKAGLFCRYLTHEDGALALVNDLHIRATRALEKVYILRAGARKMIKLEDAIILY